MTVLLLQTALDKGESEPGEACLLIVWGDSGLLPCSPVPVSALPGERKTGLNLILSSQHPLLLFFSFLKHLFVVVAS